MIGTTLAQFTIKAKLGEGGMGEVWRAEDGRLGRDVALKILPEEFASDSERVARFEREAKVLASLNHPSIATLFGLETVPGAESSSGTDTVFLAMELVEGEDLSDRIARGPLPVDDAVRIALQVAEAVEAAHEQGVVHRDLKPANVRMTHDGRAKVLDFGLAKALDPILAEDTDKSATITSAGTVAGMILGTAAYMSPEQASGQPTDRRCDIWSFGVMLNEMLTGKRLFEGETTSHTLADVLRAPIDLEDLPGNVPAKIRRLIERCLERDRMRRLRDIGEARIALQDVIDRPDEAQQPGAPVSGGPGQLPKNRLPWAIASLAAVLAVVGFLWSPRGDSGPVEPTRRFALEVPNSGNTRQGDGLAVAISSDGRSVVTRGGSGAEDMLHIRHMDDFEARPIEGTFNGRSPIFSPDDRWIAFIDATGLQKVRSNGGPKIFLTPFPSSPNGMDWAADGWIYYANQGEIWRVSENGGESEQLWSNDLKESRGYVEPFMIPGTNTLLCSSRIAIGGSGELFVFDLAQREIKALELQGTHPRYLPTGHLLYALSDRVFVAPFDIDEMRVTGQATPVLARAWVDQGEVQADFADNGTVVYLPNSRGETQTLVAVDFNGKVEELVPGGLPFSSLNDPRISPDGRRLMLSVDTGAIWMLDLDTQTPTLMTEEGFYPQWSPDGRDVLFGSTRNKTFDIYRRPVDLSRPEEVVLDLENNLRSGDWTRQGPVVIREEIPGKGMDLRVLTNPNDPSSLVNLLDGPDDELAPVVSDDGKWLAYVSNYSGIDEVFVTAFPETGARHQVSMKGGHSPVWAPDGRTLYYFQGSRMVAISIETESTFHVTGREELFDGEYVHYRWSRQYDIHPSGESFVMIRNPPRGDVEVITRWFDELERAAEND